MCGLDSFSRWNVLFADLSEMCIRDRLKTATNNVERKVLVNRLKEIDKTRSAMQMCIRDSTYTESAPWSSHIINSIVAHIEIGRASRRERV